MPSYFFISQWVLIMAISNSYSDNARLQFSKERTAFNKRVGFNRVDCAYTKIKRSLNFGNKLNLINHTSYFNSNKMLIIYGNTRLEIYIISELVEQILIA
jgi:hypothetical protein